MNGFTEKVTPDVPVVQTKEQTTREQAPVNRVHHTPPALTKVTIEQVRRDAEVITFIRSANEP